MHRPVLAAARPVEAEGGDDLLAELPEVLLGVGHAQKAVVHLRPIGDGAYQLHLARTDDGEQRLDVGGRDPRLELVEQRVVGVLARRKERDVAVFQLDQSGEMRPEVRVVRSRACLDPRVL